MASSPPGLETLLVRLAASGTEFILVGALAGVAQGAPLTTFDVDVVHRRDGDNVDRLMAFLGSVDARYRGRPSGQVLRPSREALLGTGLQLLQTKLGPLDVLGSVEGGRDYADLLPGAVAIEVGGEIVRVLGLPGLVELKRGATDAKGRLALAVLEATLRRSGGGSPG
jgi:hypothetical protein